MTQLRISDEINGQLRITAMCKYLRIIFASLQLMAQQDEQRRGISALIAPEKPQLGASHLIANLVANWSLLSKFLVN
jgi:hypothetical protein